MILLSARLSAVLLSHSICCCVTSHSDSPVFVVSEAAELAVGGVSWLDVEGLVKMSFFVWMGLCLRKNKRNIVHVGFFCLLWNASYVPGVQCSEKNFSSIFCATGDSTNSFLLGNHRARDSHLFTVAKTPWNTASEPASTMRCYFVSHWLQLPECSAHMTSSCKCTIGMVWGLMSAKAIMLV